jgi:hypothetical protein
VLVEPSPLTES